jgi:hypothetical protein
VASVYVFNATEENINLVINNGPAGSIAGFSPQNGYALQPTSFPLGAGSNPGQFGSQNQLVVQTNGGQQIYQVQMGSGQPPGIDYQLFIFANCAMLSSQYSAEMLSAVGGGNPYSSE